MVTFWFGGLATCALGMTSWPWRRGLDSSSSLATLLALYCDVMARTWQFQLKQLKEQLIVEAIGVGEL